MSNGSDMSRLRERGFAGRTGFGSKPALIVIDFTNAFTDPTHALGSDVSRQIDSANALIREFRGKGLPIIFTTIEYATAEQAAGSNWRSKIGGISTLYRGSKDVDLDTRLDMAEDDLIISKEYASAFFGTDLARTLRDSRIDTVVITGCSTSGCVRATVVDACQHGLRPIVCREGVADRDPVAEAQALTDIELKYGDVMSSAEIQRELDGISAAGD